MSIYINEKAPQSVISFGKCRDGGVRGPCKIYCIITNLKSIHALISARNYSQTTNFMKQSISVPIILINYLMKME